jgi:hypothetical protein
MREHVDEHDDDGLRSTDDTLEEGYASLGGD